MKLAFYALVDRLPWTLLILAGAFEILWGLSLKWSEGYTRLVPTLATIPLALLSTSLLAMAMRNIPISTAYAVWVGIGTVGLVVVGIIWQGEVFSWTRAVCMLLIILGIIGLKLASVEG